MTKYILLAALIVILLSINVACVSNRKSPIGKEKSTPSRRERPKEIEMSFKLNKGDYSYSFTFLNLSKDTFSIAAPQVRNFGNTGGYFQLFDEELYETDVRCAIIHGDDLAEWIVLMPGRKETTKSSLNLEKLLCPIKPSFYLGYSYWSFIKHNDGRIKGMFNFDIQPTMIGLLDSVTVRKFIF
jgi:hypothetical protein